MRLEQLLHLACGHHAAADHDDQTLAQIDEDRQVVHGLGSASARRHGRVDAARGCRPHSFESLFSHHQRPERLSSPGSTARVQGAQPMLG